MRKILWTIAGFWLCGLLAAAGAASFSLADGTTVGGDIVSFNDNGIIFRSADDKYTDRLPWVKFSQEGLKQLAQNPKIDPFVAPFILPAPVERAPKPEVKVRDVPRLDRSSPASLFGGLFSSGIGLVALLLIYAANLYAGYEIALFRARPVAVVVGAAAVLPVAGPIIFLSLPGLRETAVPAAEASAETPAEGSPAANAPHRFVVPGVKAEEEIHIATGSWEAGAPSAPPPSRKRRFSSADSSCSTAGFSRRSFPDFSASSAAKRTRTRCCR